MAETQMTLLDEIMKTYIDSGRYSESELAEIRKREANKLKESRETSWWRGEEGFIPDEFQSGVNRPNVPGDLHAQSKSPIVESVRQATILGKKISAKIDVKNKAKEIEKQKKQEERVEKYGGKVDAKVKIPNYGGRGMQAVYSKHEGLDEKLRVLDATEEEYVPALNKFYEEKGVDVRFVEANPVWTDWLNVGSSWNTIEVLIGDQKNGEGFKIPMYDKGSGSKFGESVSSLNEITSKIRSHIDENMGSQYYELDNSVTKTKNNEELYDELSEIFTPNDLVLDDNQTNRARFANKGDIVTGNDSFAPKEGLPGIFGDAGIIDVKEGTGLRLQSHSGFKGLLGLPQEILTLGAYDSYTADMSGGVTLKDGTFVSYEYIFDKRQDILKHSLEIADSKLTKEKVESFGSEEEYNNYLEDNSWVYFNKDEQEYYKLKRELENVRSGRSEGDEEALINRLEQIADEKEWKTLYDENGKYLDIKMTPPEEGSEGEGIEVNAEKLAKDLDKVTLKKLRQQSAIRLENLAKIASGNSAQILEEMMGSVPAEVANQIGGWFDFSSDSYDDDMVSLAQIVESGDLFGSDKPLTNLPGGSDLQRMFDNELLKFKTLSRAYDLNINIAQNPEYWFSGRENILFEFHDNLSRAFTGEAVWGTIEDESRDIFEATLEAEGYDVERFGESGEEFGFNRYTYESITKIGTDLAPLLTELYFLKKAGGTKKIHSGVQKLTNIFTGGKNKSKTWAKVIDKFAVPAIATPIEWSIAEVAGEHAFGDMGGVNSMGEDSFKAHTINLETGETNFTMPVTMGLMGPAWATLSGRMYSRVANTAVGKYILPKVMNKQGFMHGMRKGGGKMLGQGTTGSAMLLVAESVQAAIDSAIKDEDISLAEKLKDTWTVEHFMNTAAALSILSVGKVHPSWMKEFKRDVAHLKGETVESNNAAKELGVVKRKNGFYGDNAIKKAVDKKIEEINKDSTLNAEAKKKKIEEAKVNGKHLKLFNEVKNFKKQYQKPDSKTGKNRMDEYNRMQWEAFENLKKDLTSSSKDYDAIAKMKPWKVEELLRLNGIDIGSAQGKWYMNTRDYISHLTQLAELIGYKKTDSTRDDYIRDTISIERNKSRIEEIEKSIKDGKGGESLGAELRSLKETNKKLYEANDIRFKQYQTKWNSLLKAEIDAARNLAEKLGSSVKQHNKTQWSNLKDKNGNKLDPEADAAYVDGVLHLNMRVLRLRKNLGAPVHEVVHHILRNSFKYKSGAKKGKVTRAGINIIKQLVNKFSLKEQAIIQKRIDDNYRYEENLDGSFKTDSNGKKIEKHEREYYEEYITSISDAIKNKDIKFNIGSMRKAGKLVYPWLKNIGMSNLYKYDLNGSRSTKAAQDLYNLLGDVSAAKQVRAETIEGLRELAGDKAGLHPDAVSSKSKDIYQNDRISENLGITKKSTKEIIEKNREIENKIVEENIRDANGNLQASTRNQQRLVENNMAASFKLALEAANKAKHITLEEGLKYDDVNEWFSDYNAKLVDLARTYRAERVFDPKTKKVISPPEKVPFGAYMGGLLPKKYSGILEAGKAKIQAKSMSEAGVAKKVGKMPTVTSTPSAFETNGKTIKIADRLGPQGKRIKNMVMSTVNLISSKPYSIKDGKKIDLTKATFKSLKNVVLKEVQKEVFGIDPKTGNLSKTDVKNAQMVISKHADMFKAMLPEHHTIKMVKTSKKDRDGNPIYEARPDKATGIENVLLEAFYDKGVRKDNLTPWTKKKNIKTSDFLEVFGVMERGIPNSYKKDSNTSSRIHALVKQVERMVVNQSVREKLKEMGFGKEEWFSVVAEGRSEGMYSKSIYRNENVGENTIYDFDYKKRAFHREIGIQGLTPQAISRAYDNTYGKNGLQDIYGASLKAKVVNDYKAFLKPYVAKMGSYTVNKEKFPVDVAEYLASVSVPDAAQAVARMMGVKKSMVELFRDPKQKERYQEFNTDMLSDRIDRKIEEIVDSKEIERIKDKAIADEIRGKSHLENSTNNPKYASAFHKKDNFIKEHLVKIPGYENLINYKKGGGTKKEPGRYIELEFKDGKTRKVKLPESSEFDGKQKTTQEMVDDNVSKREMDLRKENAKFHQDRVMEILEGASKLIENKTYGKEEVAMLMGGLLGNMKTSLRSAALFRYAPVNPPTRKLTRKVWNAKEGKFEYKKNFEYEHGIPAKDMAVILAGHYFFGKKVDLQKLWDSYSVGVVHVDFNRNFGEVFRDRMQFNYEIGDIPPKRWFNEWTAMGEAHMMRDVYTGEIYGEAQVNYWNKVKENHKKTVSKLNKTLQDNLGPQYSKSNKREIIKDLQTVDKAVRLARKLDQKKKGMSTWDFDDTLATTKSGVRARIPNVDGLPKPNRKVIFLAGGAGSGKGNVIKKLNLEGQGFKIVNSDISLEWLKKNHGLPENMNDFTREQRSILGKLQHQARGVAKRKMMKYQGEADGVVVDGTGGSIKAMEKLVNEFKSKGYDVSMMFVETSLKTALERNKARKERSLLDKIVEKNHEAVQGNKSGFKTMFGERFMEVKTDKLKQEDAMPIDLVNKMNDFVNGYEKIRLDAEQFATEGQSILDKGGKFDFSEFNVITGGQRGPFFEKALNRAKKYGTKDQFILTARPMEAAGPIHEFLKSQGLEIPLKNITGLGNSTGEAKAMWMLEKFSEGYNDMYFADDALRNVEAVKNILSQLDIKSKVQLVEKKNTIESVKDVEKLDSPENYNNIKYSKSHRAEYEKTISKYRFDLVKDKLVSKTIDRMFDFVDGLDVPDSKKRKYEQITTKWLATSNIKLREDGYKVERAIELAEKYKEDIFSYNNPNQIIEKYAGKIKEKPTDPKTVKEFAKGTVTNKKHGITEHVVENTKEGQEAVRKVMDTHFGENSNPWCLAQKKNGKLTENSWEMWEHYSDGPKSLVFQNGKLIGFKASGEYWDRMDNATDAPVVKIKDGRVTKTVELVPIGGGKVSEFVMETRTVSKDKKTVTTEYFYDKPLDAEGYAIHPAGTKIVERRVNGQTTRETTYRPNGDVKKITNFKDGKAIETRTFRKGKTTSINNETRLDVEKHGDMINYEFTEGKNDLWFGEISMEAQGFKNVPSDHQFDGKNIFPIGFKTRAGFDVMNIMKRIDGKLRVDLGKLSKIDPDIKGLPKGIVDSKSIQPSGVRYSKSKDMSRDFNKILEEVKGVKAEKTYSEAKGALEGAKAKGTWFGTPGMEDFSGLVTYAFAGKGERGQAHIKFFNDNLQRPFNRAYNEIHNRKQRIGEDYKALRKAMPEVRKRLNDKVDGIYNVDQAIRVYNFNKAGHKVPGLSKADLKKLINYVESKPELVLFADQLSQITMLPEGYLKPADHWLGENITIDMNNVVERVFRKDALGEFVENRKAIFGEWKGGKIVGENMNKIEAIYGPKHREALENMLWRMENGTNRTVGADSNTNKWMNWVNDATGTIMFFNQKSAVLQTISSLNYVNGSFNNPFRAAQAFANQPQYWKDFAMIFNSNMLVQRRAGLKINIEAAELLERVGSKKGGFARFRAFLLEKGFIPTKYADSFAIASGGATFYRNSVRKYKKQGMSVKEAEAKAWEDFMQMTEATQQSSRPDLISMQQASALGRPILAFANTPMQMFRRHKRRIQDIANRRGNVIENTASALYYGFAQTMIFSFLANAMFAVDDESDDPDKIKHAEKQKSRYTQTIVDSYLRGMGTGGAAVSALKNGLLSFFNESDKANPDYGNTVIDMLNVSPPIGSKARKLYSAGKSHKYDRDIMPEMGFRIDNPAVMSIANVISATTNLPTDRVVMKLLNLKDASNGDFETWQRIAMFLGVNKWVLGVEDEELEAEMKSIEKRVDKEKKKEKETKEDASKIDANKKKQIQEKKQGKKNIKCAAVNKSGNRCKTTIESGSSFCTIHAKVKQRSDGKKVQCKGRRTNKKRCGMMTSNKSGYCYYHD